MLTLDFGLAILGIVIGIASLWIGCRSLELTIKTIHDSEKLSRDSKKMIDGLREVGESLTTHRVGESPAYASILARLISESNKSLKILTTFPTIGVFENPVQWEKLRFALTERQYHRKIDANDVLRITMIIASPRARRAALEDRFYEAVHHWESWSTKAAKKLEAFARNCQRQGAPFSGPQDFLDFNIVVQNEVLEKTYSEIVYTETDHPLTINCWISDDTEAFFTIANPDGRSTTGFMTRDKNLIDSFKSIMKRYEPTPRAEDPQTGDPAVGVESSPASTG